MRIFYKKHRIVRVLIRILIVIIVILFAAFMFLKFCPAFGGTASKEDKLDYKERAANYSDGKFRNEGDFSILKNANGAIDNAISTKGSTPNEEIPIVEPTYLDESSSADFSVTWFGHSTLLIQMNGMNILIDPMFSEYASPVQLVGSKRFSTPLVSLDELPDIDVVLISHDHYDHLDYNTIMDIDDKVTSYVVPLGVENHLERWGIASDRIQNMAWWEEIEVNGLTIGCTPAKHYSGRSLTDQYATLWASWVLKDDDFQVFESGDTGFGNQFEEIHNKYGDFNFVLLDCAQYDVRWPDVHMNPEEAYKAAQILNSAVAMPIHWAAFQLANHPWDDPAERFVRASEGGNIPVVTPMIGETMKLNEYMKYRNLWWRNVD